jgi:hypothetical protein
VSRRLRKRTLTAARRATMNSSTNSKF